MQSTFLYGGNVRANGIRQHYLRFGGKGPCLVIVPGITSPAITWEFVGHPLGQKYDVYVLDVRGRGLSSASPTLDYSTDALGADVAAFVQEMGIKDYGLLGHSMGGRIVPRAVAKFKAAPSRLMLVDPPVTGPGRKGHGLSHEWYTDQIEAGAQGTMTVDDMRQYFPRWSDEALRLRVEWIHTCDPRAVIQTREDFLVEEMHSELAVIDCPINILIGNDSDLISHEEEVELLDLNPKIETHRMEGVGHMVPWDDLDGFLKAVDDFFLD